MTNLNSTQRGWRVLISYLLLGTASLGVATTAWALSRSPASTVGPEGVAVYRVPNLAAASTTLSGRVIDGIGCQTQGKESVKYHIHIRVAIYVNGHMVRLPGGIGVTQPQLVEKYSTGKFYDAGLYDCLYWLHTHVADGIIHVEAPTKQAFTLGQFFDVWNQPLGISRLGPAKGAVVVFENGKKIAGNLRNTRLLAGGVIQIDVGTPVIPYHSLTYKVTGGCGEGKQSCSLPKG
jgi:hypothetical protein